MTASKDRPWWKAYIRPGRRYPSKPRPARPPKPTCQHCGVGLVNRPRGLCWVCYYTPGVRELYPSTSKFAHRGLEDFHAPAPLPEQPTSAPPTTPEKVAVFCDRAERRESLFHPADAGDKGLDYRRTGRTVRLVPFTPKGV